MKRRTPWWQTALLVIFAAALAFGAYQASAVGNHLQYLITPPPQAAQTQNGDSASQKHEPNSPVRDWNKSLKSVAEEWNSTMRAWTLGGVVEQASFSCDAGSGQGRLTLLGENGLLLHPLYLRSGRAFFPEELQNGSRVILLDEQLALAMFHVSDPLERTVSLDGAEYRVIGVVRHKKQVGDLMDHGAYIPLMSVIDQPTRLDALMVEAEPMPGMGANVSFAAVCDSWQSGGTMIDLGKEGMAATLWLRVLLFLAGMTLTLRLIRWLNGRAAYYGKHYRLQLQRQYALRLMPQLIGVILLFALGYGAAAALAALLMNYIIQPVYTFPEWIPAVLVEWADMEDAFWKVWQTSATLRELRSPEILRLRYLTLLVQGCSAAAGVLLALRYARMSTAADRARDSLPALYREGVAVSLMRTQRPIALAELGYVPCADDGSWADAVNISKRRKPKDAQPMMRIINVRRVLAQLPLSPREGSFVLEVTDGQIAANNGRWLITCTKEARTMEECERDWDIQLSVQTLTRLVYGRRSFNDFLENNAGYDMRMRSEAMDGLFDHHLTLTDRAL